MPQTTPLTPRESVIARVRTWSGIRVNNDRDVSMIVLDDKPIGRFPSQDTLEAVLCGSVGGGMLQHVYDLPDGVWPTEDRRRVLIDLAAPAGFEEAVRVLLNSYLIAHDKAAKEWFLKDAELAADPGAEKAAQAIDRHRAARTVAAR